MTKVLLNPITAALLLFSSTAVIVYADVKSPLPQVVAQQWGDFTLVGETTLRKFGLHIYDASFWQEQKNNAANARILSITYARNIKASQLLKSTNKEWKRLGYTNKYPLQSWLQQLETIWPDVAKGDQLIAVAESTGKTTFYSHQTKLGTIENTDFGSAFFAIWLDKDSRYQKHRNELLGL